MTLPIGIQEANGATASFSKTFQKRPRLRTVIKVWDDMIELLILALRIACCGLVLTGLAMVLWRAAMGGAMHPVRLGLLPETLVTPWWVFVTDALSDCPVSYIFSLEDVRARMARDLGTRSGKA